MAYDEREPLKLDTAAYRIARAGRSWRRGAYWLTLAGAALGLFALFVGLSKMLADDRSSPSPARVAAPAATSVAATSTSGTAGVKAGGGASSVTKKTTRRKTARRGAKPLKPADTGVLVWNGFGGQGAAAVAADRLRRYGYPITDVTNATRRDYSQSFVLYKPGPRHKASAWLVARRLGLDPRRAVRPLDGIPRRTLGRARLLVILARRI